MRRTHAVSAALLGSLAAGWVARADDPPPPPPLVVPVPVLRPANLVQKRLAANVSEAASSPDQAELDKKALEAVGLKPEDTAGVLKYLKDRTLTDVDLNKINAVIQKFNLPDFEDRVKAMEEIERIGQPALGPLKLAAKDESNPPEVLFRARLAVKRMEKVSYTEVAAAAARALAGAKHKDIVPTLLGFLPLADSPQVVEQIQATLVANAGVAGQPDPALLAALKDGMAVRRTAAVVALVEGAGITAEAREKQVGPAVKAVLDGEKDVAFRFAVARSFILSGTEKAGVKLMIDLLPELNRSQIWQAEDLLTQLGGADGPKERCLKTAESKVAAAKAWAAWWAKAEGGLKFGPGVVAARTLGKFHLVTFDIRFGQNGMVTEYGPDEKEKWRLGNLGMPVDAAFRPNGRLLVADQNQNAIVEWNPNGTKLSSRRFEFDTPGGGGKMNPQPKGFQQLPDGGVLVYAANALAVYDKDGKATLTYVRPQGGNQDLVAACKLKGGDIAVSVLNNGPNGQEPKIIFLDAKGQEIKDRSVKTGPGNSYLGSMTEVADGRVLLTEVNQLVEYDLATGKVTWKKAVNQPGSVQRLPSGNTLFVDRNQYPPRVIEQTADGQEAWSFGVKNNEANVTKAFVR